MLTKLMARLGIGDNDNTAAAAQQNGEEVAKVRLQCVTSSFTVHSVGFLFQKHCDLQLLKTTFL
jgi:hypothetical protein